MVSGTRTPHESHSCVIPAFTATTPDRLRAIHNALRYWKDQLTLQPVRAERKSLVPCHALCARQHRPRLEHYRQMPLTWLCAFLNKRWLHKAAHMQRRRPRAPTAVLCCVSAAALGWRLDKRLHQSAVAQAGQAGKCAQGSPPQEHLRAVSALFK